MRFVPPLDEEAWNELVADLEKGQTEGQRRIMEEARELYGSEE